MEAWELVAGLITVVLEREEQGPNTQGPQERQSSKLHALKSLQAAIFETKQGGEIYNLISPVDHIFEAVLQLAMGTEKTVVPPMPPVIIPMMYVAELVPGKVKLLSKLFEKIKAVLFLLFSVVRTDIHD